MDDYQFVSTLFLALAVIVLCLAVLRMQYSINEVKLDTLKKINALDLNVLELELKLNKD